MTALDRTASLKLALMVFLLGIFAVSTVQATPAVYNLCAQQLSGPGCIFTATTSVNGVVVTGGDESGEPGDDDPAAQAPILNLIASPTARGGVTVTGTFGFTADVPGLNEYALVLQLTGPTSNVPLGALAIAGLLDFNADPGAVGGILGTITQFGFTQNGFPYAQTVQTGTEVNHGVGSTQFAFLDPGAPVTDWTMTFGVDWFADQGSTLAIDFPLTEDPVPEPVSVLLVGSGIGLLALLRRWRKA